MDARMQKHRMMRWMGRGSVAFTLACSSSAQAALEYVAPIESWCGGLWVRYTELNDCGFPTKLAAAKATAAAFNVVYPPTKWTATSCETTMSADGDSICSGTATYANGSVQTGNFWSVRINYDCPVPTVNPNITYYFNSTIMMCQRPAQQSLTITLSGATEVEPSNSSKTKFLPIIATVIDQSTNQPPTNPVKVHVSLKVEDPKSGGHEHGDSTRPRGGIAEVETCDSDSECWPGPQSTNGKGMTDGNGQVVFNFNAPEASGKYTITAICDGCNSSSPPKTVDVKVNGLKPIPVVPLFYALVEANGKVIGAKPGWHTDNHNLTHAAAQELMIIASQYRTLPQFKVVVDKKTGRKDFPPALHINDASLPWGGVYDICARPGACPDDGVIAWQGPHKEHRRGTVVDVRANGDDGSIPASKKIAFIRLLKNMHIPHLHENYAPPTSNEHFHIRLLGNAE